jgi:hypothetical protein
MRLTWDNFKKTEYVIEIQKQLRLKLPSGHIYEEYPDELFRAALNK